MTIGRSSPHAKVKLGLQLERTQSRIALARLIDTVLMTRLHTPAPRTAAPIPNTMPIDIAVMSITAKVENCNDFCISTPWILPSGAKMKIRPRTITRGARLQVKSGYASTQSDAATHEGECVL